MLLFDLVLLFGLELKFQAFVALFCVLGVFSLRSEHFSFGVACQHPLSHS